MRTLIICQPCSGHMYMSFSYYIYVLLLGMCSYGLGVIVEDLLPRGPWFEPHRSSFFWKISTWWEIFLCGNRKWPGKIPLWWEISLSGRKKVFRCMDHLVLRHPSYMRGFTCPFSFSVAEHGWDLAQWLERLTVNAVVATVLGSILASSDTVESEGRQMKQC